MHNEPRVMSQIAELLEQMDTPARAQVIGWAISALDIQVSQPSGNGEVGNGIASSSPRSADTLTVTVQGEFSAATEDWVGQRARLYNFMTRHRSQAKTAGLSPAALFR
jgi:hypothetical protein